MTTLKTTSRKTASHPVKHPDIRLRKIRSLKTSVLQLPKKVVTAAARMSETKSSVKSIVPYSLVIASLVLSGATAGEAHAAVAHAKTAKAAHVVTHHVAARHVATRHVATHVVRRYAVAAEPLDPVAQFFQALFGTAPVVRTARGRVGEGEYVPSVSPTEDTSTPVISTDDPQAASNARVQAIQQLNDINAMNASIQAAEEQNDAANAATLQTEINANSGM